MKYINTKNKLKAVNFKQAVFRDQAEDGGLYMPAQIPEFGPLFIRSLSRMSNVEVMYEILKPYLRDFISNSKLLQLIEQSLNFKIPLVRLSDNKYVLELFHGPTKAFKDVGARFLAGVLNELKDDDQITRIIVATSGDTGSAVADAFSGKEGFEVYVLFPKEGVSKYQEQQITATADNVFPIEVNGSFDDCQRLLKAILQDKSFSREMNIVTANSINVGRLLPQIAYYFLAYKQLPHKKHDLLISVPCGNLGNITAGVMAQKMGLPVSKFVAAVNENKVFYDFLKYGKYKAQASIKTYSNAMDVGNPSNLERLLHIYNQDVFKMMEDISSKSVNNVQCIEGISNVYKNYRYICDPHSAVAYQALQKRLKVYQSGIFLATADPVKFESVVRKAIPAFKASDPITKAGNKYGIENNLLALRELIYS